MKQIAKMDYLILGFENGDSIGLPPSKIAGFELSPVMSTYRKLEQNILSKSKMCMYFNIKVGKQEEGTIRSKNGIVCRMNIMQRLAACDLATITLVIIKQDGSRTTEQVPVAAAQKIESDNEYVILRNTNYEEFNQAPVEKGMCY